MILDERLEFADALAAVGSGVSQIIGDVVDRETAGSLGGLNVLSDLGTGKEVFLVIQITTAYSGGTSAAFSLRSDSTSNLTSSPTTHVDTGAIAVASLPAGTVFVYRLPPGKTYEKYLGMWLVTVGAVAAGALNAFLTNDASRWAPYADNVS